MSQQVNLYTPLFRKQKKVFTAATMMQSLGLLVVMLVAFYGYARHQVVRLESQVVQFDLDLKAGLEQVKSAPGAPVGPLDEKSLDQRLVELEAQVRSNQQLIGQTAQTDRGYIEPLRALARQRVDGVWLTSINLSGESGEVSVTGRARTAALIPQYIERLGQDPAMRGRRFATLSIEQDAKAASKSESPASLVPAPESIGFRLLATGAEGG